MGRLREISFTLGYSQYRNAVASGRVREISFTLGYSQYRNAIASGRVRETDPPATARWY